MPQRIEKLRETLHELEEELERLDTLDNESRELLETARADIQEALGKCQPPEKLGEPPASDPQIAQATTWTDRLFEVSSDFEQSHPTLSRIVGNVANALAQLGI